MPEERPADVWREGDPAVLKRAAAAGLLLRLARGPQAIGERGVLDLSGQIGRPPGEAIEWLGARYRLVRPAPGDLLAGLERGAQIVTAKDAAYLAFLAGVVPGAAVAEAGAGSGALTIVLASAVGAQGRVYSYDRRPEHLEAARRNVERTGLGPRVTFRERDVARDGLGAEPLDSVILDLPEPWAVCASARATLRVGGFLATYTPTYNQLERTVRELRAERFDDVRALELLERPIQVGEGGTRPSFEMLGHTAFLAVGRKVD